MQAQASLGIVGIEVEHGPDLSHPVGKRVPVNAQPFRGRPLGAAVFEIDPERLAQQSSPIFPQQLTDEAVDVAVKIRCSPSIVEQAKRAQVDIVVELDLVPEQEPPLLQAGDEAYLPDRLGELPCRWDGRRHRNVDRGVLGNRRIHHHRPRPGLLDRDDAGR